MSGTPEPKACAACGRRIAWRKKWEKDWDAVRYCSQACRRRKIGPEDEALEAAIRRLLDLRRPGATICPSEAARAVASEEGWRDLMEPARRAARRLVARGEVEITQQGRPVDPSTARGAIRIRKARGVEAEPRGRAPSVRGPTAARGLTCPRSTSPTSRGPRLRRRSPSARS